MLPIIPLALGGAIGAVVALAASPRSGKENREIVAEKLRVNEARDRIAERVADLRSKDDRAPSPEEADTQAAEPEGDAG